jgi:hypothetical protein
VNINSFEKLWGNETITIELHPSPINRRRKLYTFIPDPSTGGGSCHLHPILTLMYRLLLTNILRFLPLCTC